ncbi:MAG: hypothetical protein KAU50_09040 [Candidatus Marinimicrobia bacterium]|nr:hypothetical protein [Candidatus Neomarinimicrobiota bacterium]
MSKPIDNIDTEMRQAVAKRMKQIIFITLLSAAGGEEIEMRGQATSRQL